MKKSEKLKKNKKWTKDTENKEIKPKPATTSTTTVYNAKIVTTITSTNTAKHSNTPKNNMISQICEKKETLSASTRKQETQQNNQWDWRIGGLPPELFGGFRKQTVWLVDLYQSKTEISTFSGGQFVLTVFAFIFWATPGV